MGRSQYVRGGRRQRCPSHRILGHGGISLSWRDHPDRSLASRERVAWLAGDLFFRVSLTDHETILEFPNFHGFKNTHGFKGLNG